MKKFSDMIQKSGEPDKNAPSGVIKGRVATVSYTHLLAILLM